MRFTTQKRGRLPSSDAAAIEHSLVDGEAFMAVYERHAARIHGYMHRRFEPALAQDLASETFVAAFASRASYDLGRSDAAPWLFGIAANIAARHWRDESYRTAALERVAGEFNDAGASGLEPADAIDQRTAAALRALPDEQREALCLLAWGELSYDEIAAALDVPIGTVRSRISRGREGFRLALESDQELSPEGVQL
ncbi:MAG: sigma-70 family RNA polymerase sigma factor [Solirubrobacterales bacterium]